MNDQPTLEFNSGETDDALNLANYAQRAYLEYALSVVKGRALPDVCDGQKPVQRRILYSMDRMGLGYNGNTAAKPVKSARVVGDVLGRYHPHGDTAAYDALVRMAQDFSQRYPLIDGQGNFGSRDGDGAAAMRYTEARLSRITGLLLDEIDMGTVDFVPNYDGSTEEPSQLPARLPFTLLNGASGIAVGLATEIPSHNLREVADACIALVKNDKLSDEELLAIIPGPDYCGGGQIISPASDIADAYRTGRGSLKVRARWKIEDLARGQWQLVVTELPPGVSSQKVLDRIHILEGRQLVLLNIDEVIHIIRSSDEPKAALIERFKLSDRQAEDILEIRLRQLARLEAIKIEQELSELRGEQGKLEEILGSPAALRRLMVKEIELDAKTFADARRTLIQEEKKAVAEVKVVDEPVTVVISEKGWVRARQAHGHDATSFAFKAGDGLYGTFECRTVDQLIIFGTNGRVYSVPVAALPGARGDGQPITTLIELESGTQPAHYFAGPISATLLLSGSGGYGFLATVEGLVSRNKGGKSFISLGEGETVCAPSHVSGSSATVSADKPALPAATSVACASTGGRILTFDISELKLMEKGGRGLMLIDLEAKDQLAGAAAYTRSVKIEGIGRGGKAREETLEIRSLNNAKAARAKKGKLADLGFKPTRVSRVE